MSYPVVMLRLKALLLDSTLLGILVMALVMVAIKFAGDNRALKTVIILVPSILFEPILIWLTGGSIGHHYAGIKVVSGKSGKNLFVVNGVLRFLTKSLLGVVSLASMLITKRHQSLHDVVSGSVVIFKDESNALRRHKLRERVVTKSGVKPSLLRRILVALVYVVLVYFVLSLPMGFVVPAQCLDHNICSSESNLIISAYLLLLGLSLLAIVVLSFLSKLPGANYAKEK